MSTFINAAATGNINFATFVKLDTTADNSVLQASSGSLPVGVSSEAIYNAPITGANSYAAVAGQSCRVYGPGCIVNLQADASGFTRGDKLKPSADGNGYGTTTTTSGDLYGAIALESAPAGALARVLVWLGKV